jgi:hypothetical protein
MVAGIMENNKSGELKQPQKNNRRIVHDGYQPKKAQKPPSDLPNSGSSAVEPTTSQKETEQK